MKEKLFKNERVKNTILIVIVVVTILGIAITINYAKNDVTSVTNDNMKVMQKAPVENDSNDDAGVSDNMSEPPEKPSSDNTESNEPPAKPSDDTESNNPPAKPDDNNSDISNEKPNDNKTIERFDDIPNRYSIKTKYYVILGLESLVLVSVIIYLVMSKFNKKGIKETFTNKDKVLIYILLVIIMTFVCTFLESYVTNKYLVKDNMHENTKSTNTAYTASKEINSDTTLESGDYSSTSSDENAILVSDGANATLSNISINKTGDSDGGDNTSFYGTNSAILAKDGSNLVLKNINVTTNATGSNGVFSYGGSATTNNNTSDNTTVTISDSSITTTKDNSGGIMTTGGGFMKAYNLTVNTSGISSAAIRSDRGGGTVEVDGGTYTTTGQGSPAIYSTANITVNNAKLNSKSSEGIIIEGKNSVTINNCDLTDNNTKLNGQSTTYKNIFLYQSMSGDASDGNALFNATDSIITTNNGDSFYVTNTTATINLKNNKITNNDSAGNFLRVQKDSWGKSGSNGGDVTLIMTEQKVTGNIVVDSISTLAMTMKSNSYYEGTINEDNSAKTINLTLDKTSKIKLTGDSYVTSLTNEDTTNSNINFNGYKLYVNGQSIN